MENSNMEQILRIVYDCAEKGRAECLHAAQPQVLQCASVLETLAGLQAREVDHDPE